MKWWTYGAILIGMFVASMFIISLPEPWESAVASAALITLGIYMWERYRGG